MDQQEEKHKEAQGQENDPGLEAAWKLTKLLTAQMA